MHPLNAWRPTPRGTGPAPSDPRYRIRHGHPEAPRGHRPLGLPPREAERTAGGHLPGTAGRGHPALALRRGRAGAHPGRAADPGPAPQVRPRGARTRRAPRAGHPRDAASGNHLPLVLQGHRHRPPVRARGRAAGRARHRLPPRRKDVRDLARPAATPRPDDGGGDGVGGRGRRAVPPLRAEAPEGDRRPRPRPRRARRGQPGDGPRPRPGRGRLPPRVLRAPGPQSDRRRADDVRPGELRALPPQDLQCLLDRGREDDAPVALPDDPRDGEGEPAGHGERVLRQRGGDGRPHRSPLLRRTRDRALCLPRGSRPTS